MLPQEIIRKKRDGSKLSTDELRYFAQGIADGSITEGQVAAFAMAVFFQHLDADECAALTLAMRDTGEVMEWASLNLPGPVIDKHSTGGVGDVVSLMLGPLLAACGGYVPMISGRGLGHTGGTLDKLDSIPGYQSTPDNGLFRHTVQQAGVAIIGQTACLAPADKRFYATRDITATVENIGLITASILSKKLAAGLDALVMDVKAGNGAFMPTYEESRRLAQSIAEVASKAGTPTTALLTDMNQPLAASAGNAIEVLEAIRFLKNECVNERLKEVTFALCSEVLQTSGLARNDSEALAKLQQALDSGQAAERFALMVRSLGGPADLMERPESHLPAAPVILPALAEEEGYLSSYHTRSLGLAVVQLGGGRTRAEQTIDHRVGFDGFLPLGHKVSPGTPLARIHARSEDDARLALQAFKESIVISPEPPESAPAIYERISS
ncbi:MAG: thymidine phosphorylase [Verrucomicrobiota bacterium JB023]|nr:thymidine phosphorylase [Verrucomicrobiota bacterium JB023]